MRRVLMLLSTITLILACAACNGTLSSAAPPSTPIGTTHPLKTDPNPSVQGRKLVYRASMKLKVKKVSEAAKEVAEIATKASGHVEDSSESEEASAYLTVRVPAHALDATLKSLESLGTCTSKRVSARDITESYVDLEARLKNLVGLRDRLQTLLGKAQKVEEILAIEKELSRVQGELNGLEAKLKLWKGQVALACIHVSLQTRRIPGPIPVVFRSIGWLLGKLFFLS